MNLGENIYNAFEVVNKTHENVQKFIDFCKLKAEEKNEYELMTPKFLRYKSDVNYWGWNTTQMFLLFQERSDVLLENGWRDGYIYILEICLYNPHYGNEPYLQIAKLEYEDMKDFPSKISVADEFYFSGPLYEDGYEEIADGILEVEISEGVRHKYLGLKRVVCKEALLVDVKSENLYDIVFGTFNELKDK